MTARFSEERFQLEPQSPDHEFNANANRISRNRSLCNSHFIEIRKEINQNQGQITRKNVFRTSQNNFQHDGQQQPRPAPSPFHPSKSLFRQTPSAHQIHFFIHEPQHQQRPVTTAPRQDMDPGSRPSGIHPPLLASEDAGWHTHIGPFMPGSLCPTRGVVASLGGALGAFAAFLDRWAILRSAGRRD